MGTCLSSTLVAGNDIPVAAPKGDLNINARMYLVIWPYGFYVLYYHDHQLFQIDVDFITIIFKMPGKKKKYNARFPPVSDILIYVFNK